MILYFTVAGFSAPLKPLQERAFVAFFYVFFIMLLFITRKYKVPCLSTEQLHIFLSSNEKG